MHVTAFPPTIFLQYFTLATPTIFYDFHFTIFFHFFHPTIFFTHKFSSVTNAFSSDHNDDQISVQASASWTAFPFDCQTKGRSLRSDKGYTPGA